MRFDSRAVWPRLFMAVALAAVMAVSFFQPTAHAQDGVVRQLRDDWMRGSSLVQTPSVPFGSPGSVESLQKLRDTGATWVSIVATMHVSNASASDFHLSDTDPNLQSVEWMMVTAHQMGFRVMLQPIVISDDGVWNGLIAPTSSEEFFANYADFLKQYGEAAQRAQADLFCIGTEFFTLSGPQYSHNWADVVTKLHAVYYGATTYSANWGDKKNPEFATIDWWNLVDYIGISAYFPLSWNDFNTEPLYQGWFSYTDPFGGTPLDEPGHYYPGQTYHWHDWVDAAFAKWNKGVIFTRIGFASSANSPGRWDVPYDPYLELSVQANAYEATFRAWQNTGYLKGMFWTPWYSDPNAGGPIDNGESPQNKPAQDVLKAWYTGH